MGCYDVTVCFHDNKDCNTSNINILIDSYYPAVNKPNQQQLMANMTQKRAYTFSFENEKNAESFLGRLLPGYAHIFNVRPMYKK
jgi:hypothetical protein